MKPIKEALIHSRRLNTNRPFNLEEGDIVLLSNNLYYRVLFDKNELKNIKNRPVPVRKWDSSYNNGVLYGILGNAKWPYKIVPLSTYDDKYNVIDTKNYSDLAICGVWRPIEFDDPIVGISPYKYEQEYLNDLVDRSKIIYKK